MGASRIIIIAVSAIAAIGLALIVRGIAVRPAPSRAMASPTSGPQHPMTQVLVAKRDLQIGTRLTAGDIGWQPWPADSLNSAFITDGRAAQVAPATTAAAVASKASQVAAVATAAVTGGPMEALYGSIVREPLMANEPVVQRKLVRGGEGGYMAVVVKPGMRAFAVPVTVSTGAGGFILPGDHVDVYQSHPLDAAANGGHPGFSSVTLMKNVRVLAIDQATQPTKNAQSMVGSVATLEVPESDIDVMVRAKAQGEVLLVLRAYGESVGPTRRGAGDQVIKSPDDSVRIVRAGRMSKVEVEP